VNKKELLQETKAELVERAKELDLPGRSKMTKEGLASAIANALARVKMIRSQRGRVSDEAMEMEKGGEKSADGRRALEIRMKRKQEGGMGRKKKEAKAAEQEQADIAMQESQPGSEKAPATSSTTSTMVAPPRAKVGVIPEDMLSGRPLPRKYGKDKLILLVRDPRWIFAYWEVTPGKENHVRAEGGKDLDNAQCVLRIYDCEGKKIISSFDLQIHLSARSWYIHLPAAGRTWRAELGFIGRSGRFYTLLRSNAVTTPRDKVSDVIDSEWGTLDMDYAELFRLSGGAAIKKGMKGMAGSLSVQKKRKVKEFPEEWEWPVPPPGVVSSGWPTSFGSFGFMREAPKERAKDEFFFWVDCELILYGGTQPDAKVTVQGKPITLRPDGTFTLRYALPDGKVDMPCKAVRADGKRKREARPIVTRKTL